MSDKLRVGLAMCGSFCTFEKVLGIAENLKDRYDLTAILSETAAGTDTRFGKAKDYMDRLEALTGKPVIRTIPDAEPIGPQKLFDVLVIAPCTGNTIAKLANGIADTSVTLAAKSHLRNNRPVVIAVSTNDGLGANARNIGTLLARKHIYMVPFGQDDYIEKENSLVAHFDLIPKTIDSALNGKQLQPILV
jgi:dipicolinate synthase subunit B